MPKIRSISMLLVLILALISGCTLQAPLPTAREPVPQSSPEAPSAVISTSVLPPTTISPATAFPLPAPTATSSPSPSPSPKASIPSDPVLPLPPMDAFMKGFNFADWNVGAVGPRPPIFGPLYNPAQADGALRNLAATGTNWMALVVCIQQDTNASTEVTRKQYVTASDPALRHMIDLAHKFGMRVMLKPLIVFQDPKDPFRARIGAAFSTEEKWQAWFASYREIMLQYGILAQDTRADMFCIGWELSGTSQREADWRRIVQEVRQVYKGPITYESNTEHSEDLQIKWWDAVDYIGVDGYFPLTQKNNPMVEELKSAWINRGYLSRLESLSQKFQKPIVIPEIGYASADSINTWPVNYQRAARCPLDLQEQADCYQAALEVLWGKPWLKGIFWWQWFANNLVWPGGLTDNGYSPDGKPALEILKKYYLPDGKAPVLPPLQATTAIPAPPSQSAVEIRSFNQSPEDAVALAQAEKDIQRYRTGDAALTITDAVGQPRAGLKVEYTQTGHSFLFGVQAGPAGDKIWPWLKESGINYTPTQVAWQTTEQTSGSYQLGPFRTAAARQYNLTSTGNPLVWLSPSRQVNPEYVLGANLDQFRRMVYPHVSKIVTTYKQWVKRWTVMNEPMWQPANCLGLSTPQALAVLQESIRAVRSADPTATLTVNFPNPGNESPGGDPWSFLQEALQAGVDFDTIGLQLYYNATCYAGLPEERGDKLYHFPRRTLAGIAELIDRYSTLGKKIEITELSVPAESPAGNPGYWGEPWSPDLQAAYLKAAYTILFSKPKVEGIMWVFAAESDDRQFVYHGGLFDSQDQPRKSFFALKELLWSWTTDGSGLTDSTGQVSFRGFGGTYAVTITDPQTSRTWQREMSIREQESNLITLALD
jgi:GH35 family endo-1,4-beta-xylanase